MGLFTDRPILRDLARRPVVRDIAAVAAERVAERLRQGQTASQAELEDVVANAVASDPVLVNQLSAEPLSQSRTFMGSMAALFASLGVLLGHFFGGNEADPVALFNNIQIGWEAILGLIGAIGGAVGARGRVASGLKPMKWWNPTTWFR